MLAKGPSKRVGATTRSLNYPVIGTLRANQMTRHRGEEGKRRGTRRKGGVEQVSELGHAVRVRGAAV